MCLPDWSDIHSKIVESNVHAPQVYKSLSDEQKRKFVQSYDKNKQDGKHKDLTWVRSFEEKTTKSKSSSSVYNRGLFYGPQIFAFNNFVWEQYSEKEQDEMLKHFISKSQETFGFETKTELAGIRALNRYFYVHDGQEVFATKEENTEQFKIERGMDQKIFEEMKKETTAPVIKFENSSWVDLQAAIKDLNPCKNRLAKELTNAQDLDVLCQSKLKASKMVKEDAEGFCNAVQCLVAFVKDVREALALAELLEMDTLPEELNTHTKLLKQLFDQGDSHLSAIKEKIKFIKKKLD